MRETMGLGRDGKPRLRMTLEVIVPGGAGYVGW
jgi:hypothetical protein